MSSSVRLPPLLLTPRVELHAAEPAHAQELFALVDGDRSRLSQASHWVTSVPDLTAQRARLERARRRREAGVAFSYLIRQRDSEGHHPLVGGVSAFGLVHADRRCEIGYWIAGSHEGQGLVSEAVRALGDACFESTLHRIELRCAAENRRSVAVAQRCGYRLEGRLHQVRRTPNGWADDLLFAKLSPAG